MQLAQIPAVQQKDRNVERPLRRVRRAFGDQGIGFVDLIGDFTPAYERTGKELYLKADAYRNEIGHDLAAQIVYRALLGSGLVVTKTGRAVVATSRGMGGS